MTRAFFRSRLNCPGGAPDNPLDGEGNGRRQWSQVVLASCARYAQRGGLFEGVLIALILGLFVLDLELPLGAAPEFLYAGVVYFSLWSSRRQFPLLVTAGCTGLTLVGFLLSPAGTAVWIDLANRFFAVVLLWITLELGLARREAHQALRESHAELERRVRQRTSELSHAVDSLQDELLQRTKAERLLAESRERYRLLFDHAPYPMWIVDLDTLAFLDVNETAVRHYGYSREEFLRMTAKDIRPPEDVPRFLEAVPLAQDSPRIEGNWRHRKKDGSIIDVELGLYSFTIDGWRARLAVVNDVTEPTRITRELKESEERFRRIFDGAPIGMGIVGSDCRFLKVNEAFGEMLGYRPPELIGRTFGEITHPGDLDADLRLAEEVLRGARRSYHIEKRYRTKAGGVVWGQLTVTALRYREDGPIFALGMVQNITERKRAEAMRERLVGKIMVAQEDERRRIARDLHDGIGQTLTSLAVGLRSLEEARAMEEAAPQAKTLRRIAAEAVDEVRRIARGLRPSVLDDLGLAEAVRQYAREYRRAHGIAADVHVDGLAADRLPSAVETTLYRIIQEALTNAARHAAARTVSVVLHGTAGQVKAVIEDDGCGFDVDGGGAPCRPPGLGIQSMHERAALLNGTVAIESSPGKGTSVYVQIPLREGA
ncbi:PAS domain-containing sensor histidine kinase [Nitrospira moscoviensis]|uniref:histidine kinase n=1 Tax=Nitrospira moscoviensis TaxID=42253 RepID=A0A0K2GI41_NITMO|nr:PAS domain-containing sensor histidine kinase [Nitrospira moscoviensis]ALA60287.1 putative Response regulator/sensory box histidine kinase [Nitrospira moscoviensis]